MSLDPFAPKLSRVAIVGQESINYVEFDAVVSETHKRNAQVTDFPVEGQMDMTDHLRTLPKSLDMRVIVSDHQILFLAPLRATPSVPGTDPGDRAEAAFSFLDSVMNDKKLVTANTTLGDYDNMAILSLSCTRDKDTGNIVDMSLTMREIQIATTELITPPIPLDAAKGASRNLGKKAKKAAEAAQAARAQSTLFKLLSAFGG